MMNEHNDGGGGGGCGWKLLRLREFRFGGKTMAFLAGNAVDLFHFKSSKGHADTLPELVVLLLVVILNTSTTF